MQKSPSEQGLHAPYPRDIKHGGEWLATAALWPLVVCLAPITEKTAVGARHTDPQEEEAKEFFLLSMNFEELLPKAHSNRSSQSLCLLTL